MFIVYLNGALIHIGLMYIDAYVYTSENKDRIDDEK